MFFVLAVLTCGHRYIENDDKETDGAAEEIIIGKTSRLVYVVYCTYKSINGLGYNNKLQIALER